MSNKHMNPWRTMRRRLYEAEKEAAAAVTPDTSSEAPKKEPAPAGDATAVTDLEKVLIKSPKIRYVLMKLLTSQDKEGPEVAEEIQQIASDIKCVSYRPTTFRVIFKNGNNMDLIYDPSPNDLKNEDKLTPMDMFRLRVLGKVYDLAKNSDYEQSLDTIGICLRQSPINSDNPDIQQSAESPAAEEPPPSEEKPA